MTNMQNRRIFASLFLAGLTVGYLSINANAAQVPSEIVPLLEHKSEIALTLTIPIAKCVQKNDTRNAAFHGCIDWHSAVHGTWALVAYTAMTGDKRYQKLIDSILSKENIVSEQRHLREAPNFEMPYGRSWLLRLAIEQERYYKNHDLVGMSDMVADSMVIYFKKNPPQPTSEEYDNASWALINLIDYYSFRSQMNKVSEVKEIARRDFLENDAQCNSNNDRPGFMAICTNWAWLVSKLMPKKDFSAWSNKFIPASKIPAPIADPRVPHEYGLNFSRAWGLWEIYSVTDDPAYINAYVDHLKSTLDNPSNWEGDYSSVGHWVAQFGMFAIQPLWGPQLGVLLSAPQPAKKPAKLE